MCSSSLKQIIYFLMKCKHAVLRLISPSCVYHNSHLLLVIGGRRSLANCLFSSISFFLRACDVQFQGEAKLVKDHCRGTCFAQVARKQPFHLLHCKAMQVSMESRSKARQQLRWQWQRLAHINADTQTSGKFNWRGYGEYLQHPEARHTSDNEWFSVWFWRWRQKGMVYGEHEGNPREGQI